MKTTTYPPTIHIDPTAELFAAIQLSRKLTTQAQADLKNATPILFAAIRNQSGQSQKIKSILWSCWNDNHQVNLCDTLAGLDAKLAQAAIAMIAARAHLGGDADDLLRKLIEESGIQPPKPPTSD